MAKLRCYGHNCLKLKLLRAITCKKCSGVYYIFFDLSFIMKAKGHMQHTHVTNINGKQVQPSILFLSQALQRSVIASDGSLSQEAGAPLKVDGLNLAVINWLFVPDACSIKASHRGIWDATGMTSAAISRTFQGATTIKLLISCFLLACQEQTSVTYWNAD